MRQDERGLGSGERRDRTGHYDEVTARIIGELERGNVPWVAAVGRIKDGPQPARNGLTGQSYSGINILILWGAVIDGGQAIQAWPTFRQALPLGGHVGKGERGYSVCYVDRFTPRTEIERAKIEGEAPNSIPS